MSPPEVFVSHASHDAEIANGVVAALERHGIRCWIAPRDIKPGQSFPTAIEHALDAMRVLVLVFSSHANGSKHVEREVARASERGAPIVPFRIEDAVPKGELAYFLRNLQWLDARSPDHARHVAELVSTVREAVDHTVVPRTRETDYRLLAHDVVVPAVAAGTVGQLGADRVSSVPVGHSWFNSAIKRLSSPLILVELFSVLLFAVLAFDRVASSRAREGSRMFTLAESPGAVGTTVRVDGIRTFEGGAVPPDMAARVYGSDFPASTSRYVFVELSYSYPALPKSELVRMDCAFFTRDRAPIGRVSLEGTLAAGSTRWSGARGWGRAEPGGWTPGEFRVECRTEGALVAARSFTMAR